MHRGLDGSPLTLNDTASYVPTPPPRVIKKHDIIAIRVDEVTQMASRGEIERRKNALYHAVLNDWVHLIGLKALKPDRQIDGDQTVNGQLNSLYRAEGEMETNEALAFNIAAQIADIRPNGNLVLEAHKFIRVNNEVWEMSLSGICRPEDIAPDNVVLSRNILNLKVAKYERGHVRDSYRRGWFTKFFDRYVQPF